jgi:hypothetical protein
MKKYPDISVLIKQKAEQRRKMAALPFKEKVKIAFSLSERHKSIRKKRTSRTNGRRTKVG